MRFEDIKFSDDKKIHHIKPKSLDEPFPCLDLFNYHGIKGQKLTIETDELATRCPLGPTHYPDYAKLKLEYIPDRVVVELKSLKLFIHSFRERPISHEHTTSLICEIFADAVNVPVYIEIDWNIRGGVNTTTRLLYDPNDNQAKINTTLEEYVRDEC